MTVDIENVVRELRDDLRGIAKVRAAIEGLTNVISDLRDELQRNRIVNEDLRDVLREVRDAIHHASAMVARTKTGDRTAAEMSRMAGGG